MFWKNNYKNNLEKQKLIFTKSFVGFATDLLCPRRWETLVAPVNKIKGCISVCNSFHSLRKKMNKYFFK